MARGKLYQAYKTYREQLSAAGMITRRKRQRKDNTQSEDDQKSEEELDETRENPETLVAFLETHTHPWNEILSSWNKTWGERELILKDVPVEQYLQRFPCLDMANGYELVRKTKILLF